MRRAVLMIRQEISPRFSIRIRLNIFAYLQPLGGTLRDGVASWHAGAEVTIPSYSKTNGRQRSISAASIGPASRTIAFNGTSARIAVKSAACIGVGNGLHQLGHLGFEIIIGNDQGAVWRSHATPACHDRLIHGGFQPVIILRARL